VCGSGLRRRRMHRLLPCSMRKESEQGWEARLRSAKSSGSAQPITSQQDAPPRPKAAPTGQRGDGRDCARAAADLLNVDVSTIADWCKTGRLDSVRSTSLGPRWITLTPEIIAELRKPIKRQWKQRNTRTID
jgi:hypothetical protein